jgi:hypothetical protein
MSIGNLRAIFFLADKTVFSPGENIFYREKNGLSKKIFFVL